ncbi:MAG: family 10 glycosylhydrolase [Armatimonadota bacterium]
MFDAIVRGGRSALRLTVAALAVLLLISGAGADEIRGVWVDAWGAGFRSQSEVEALLGRPGDPNSRGAIREANLNAVFVQVRRRADVCYPSGVGEPYFSGLTPSNFNALQAVIDAAHDTTGGKQRIEVHAWIVTFATTSSGTTPPANSIYWQHNNPNDLDNYWMTLDENGNETSDKAFDPGHPRCLEYITDVCMDLITRFDIDGLHYDYIRFTANNQGYNPVSIARFNQRYGRTGQPSPSDEQFKQWRRDQITALVRRVYAKTQLVKPHVKISGAFVTWNPSPTASTRAAFQATRPYYDVYSDWDSWLQEGIIDLAVPMTYYDWATLPNDYIRWMNFQKDRKANRHVAVGPGTYLNSKANAILEVLKTREPSPAGNYAQGFCMYSYRVPFSGGTWAQFAPDLKAQVTPTPVNVPPMPWKTSPTTGHIMGTVTDFATGQWIDGGTVTVTGPVSRTTRTDGAGFYAFIDLPPGTYTITVSQSGFPNASAAVTIAAGDAVARDFQLGVNQPPLISDVAASGITNNSAVITWQTNVPATSRVEYGTTPAYGMSSLLYSTPRTAHTVTLTGLQPNTLYYYRVISTNEFGQSASGPHTFTSSGPPQISNVQVTGITATSATVTWTTNAPATSQVRYGTSPSYGNVTPLSEVPVTSHSVTISGLTPNTDYHCQAVSTNSYGAAESANVPFRTAAFSGEVIVDGTTDPEFQFIQGTWNIASASSKYGTDYFWVSCTGNASESSVTHKARWTPSLPVSGYWDLYVWYARGTNRATDSYWKIINAGTTQNIRLNQQINGNGWTLLAQSVPFNKGSAGYVELWNNGADSSKIVQGDAVRWVYVGGDIQAPTAPSGLTATALSPSSVQLTWNPATDDHGVARYNIYRGGVKVGESTATTFVDNSGLNANTVYLYEVSAVDGASNEGPRSSSVPVATLSVPPSTATVTCNRPADVWQAEPSFAFTAVGGFGSGRISYYRYAWNASATYSFSGSETLWSSGTLSLTAPQTGSFYLHVQGYNTQHIPNGSLSLGPYRYDGTPPVVLAVQDEKYTVSTDTLNASWTAEDPESGIQRFDISVGTASGHTDIRGWTDNGPATSATLQGLSLAVGQTYYVNVRAVNGVGRTGNVASSQGVTVAVPSSRIGQAKSLPDGTPVMIPARTVTAVIPGVFYAQDPDRASGIRVVSSEPVSPAQSVDLFGRLTLLGGIERALVDCRVEALGEAPAIAPVSIAHSRAGGAALNEFTPGVTDGQGLNNIGLLVRSVGRVTSVESDGFYFDDGSALQDGSGKTGLRVRTSGPPAVSAGQFVTVTGIVSSRSASGAVRPLLIAVTVEAL